MISINCSKSYQNTPMRLICYNYIRSTTILPVSVKYSIRGLIYDVNFFERAANMRRVCDECE